MIGLLESSGRGIPMAQLMGTRWTEWELMLRADSNAWWCVVCRRSSTKCLMALTPLRTARGVDGEGRGVAGSWMLARRGRLSQEQPQQSVCATFSCPMRKIERRSGLLQVGGEVFVRLGGQVRQVRQPRKRFSWIFAMYDWSKLPPGSQPQDERQGPILLSTAGCPKPSPSLLSSLFSSLLI